MCVESSSEACTHPLPSLSPKSTVFLLRSVATMFKMLRVTGAQRQRRARDVASASLIEVQACEHECAKAAKNVLQHVLCML